MKVYREPISWRDIKDPQILIMKGCTHPSYFNEGHLYKYSWELSEIFDVGLGNSTSRSFQHIPLPPHFPKGSDHASVHIEIIGFSTLIIYTWDVGKLEIFLINNNEFDHKKILEYTKKYFFIHESQFESKELLF